ncbi:MAG: hypothetical protein Q8936_01600 [Bacillota bacterium]|nr:hypothetical protein [Bacillota bacterium]
MQFHVFYCKRKKKPLLSDRTKKLLFTVAKISFMVVSLCLTQGSLHVLAAGVDDNIAKANKMGLAMWKIMLTIGYWAAAIFASKDMITDLGNSDIKQIVRTGVKYLVGYAFIFFFLDLLNLIKSFGN